MRISANAFPLSTQRSAEVRLTNYSVRVLHSCKGTSANVRVVIVWTNEHKSWSTVGVSNNFIEASWKSLVDAICLDLMRLTCQEQSDVKIITRSSG